eukprot:COSAG02_NODE_62979_length_264_cov_0.927273_1_plen_22_part_10
MSAAAVFNRELRAELERKSEIL